MEDYNFWADALNKYSQLTPWVQAVLGLAVFGGIIGLAYFMKESIAAIMQPFYKAKDNCQREWKDKYYRDEEPH